MAENNQQPVGIIGELVQEMILSSCGKCTGHGETILDFTRNGKGAAARKPSMGGVGSDVDDNTQVSFPIIGHMDDDKYLKEFVFVPVVESPGIAFISLANEPSRPDVAALAWSKSWAIVVLSVVMGFIAAVLIWLTVSYTNFMWFVWWNYDSQVAHCTSDRPVQVRALAGGSLGCLFGQDTSFSQ